MLHTVYGTIHDAQPIDREWIADCALLGRCRSATQAEFDALLAVFTTAYRARGLPITMVRLGQRLATAWRGIVAPAGVVA